ncbi:sigma factor G inhibitor Gin [Halalkalibacterium ligniniphilum]|uniref:sigma factor G inhibitor Gin n=1 Tax=Halalkalibacterium ligniniphilum TaxID=1134413 RepID=UPI000375E1A2|nr:sigma factor G inhibitor Gin [Halalkalibacterium ligniniphilum]
MSDPKTELVVVYNICLVCEQQKPSGMQLGTSFICETCEREIVQTEIDDAAYLFYVKKLRNLSILGANGSGG